MRCVSRNPPAPEDLLTTSLLLATFCQTLTLSPVVDIKWLDKNDQVSESTVLWDILRPWDPSCSAAPWDLSTLHPCTGICMAESGGDHEEGWQGCGWLLDFKRWGQVLDREDPVPVRWGHSYVHAFEHHIAHMTS